MTTPFLWNASWMTALGNHLWQSTAVAGVGWLLALALRKNQARVRYWVWLAVSLKFLLPFSLLVDAGEWLRGLLPAMAAVQSPVAGVAERVMQPFAQVQAFDAAALTSAPHHASWLPIALLAIWTCGALTVACRIVRGWWHVYRTMRSASPMDVEAAVPVLSCRTRIEPGIFGVVRPVLLMPEGILEQLSAEQLQAIVAHEMCHVRRRDNLTFVLHMIVETLFWFHPAVWWIGAKLIEERELACDEAVVQAGGKAEDYAEGILNVCKFYIESPITCVAGVTGADLKMRIVRLIEASIGMQLGAAKKTILATIALASLLGPLGVGMLYAMQAQLFHPDDHPLPSFEVATIKPNGDPGQKFNLIFPPARFATTHSSLYDLLKFAYDTKSKSQLVNGPHWLNSEFFDIQAKAEEREIEEFNTMNSHGDFEGGLGLSRLLVQTLLRDRFHLKAHFELRDLPVYALTVVKGGPKIHEVKIDVLPSPGTKSTAGGHYPNVRTSGPNQLSGTLKLAMMADLLTNFDEVGDRIVVDRTNLAGYYDFVLNDIALGPQQPSSNGAPAAGEGTISLFTALREQLGLELVPQDAPVEVLVIDHVEQPTPN